MAGCSAPARFRWTLARGRWSTAMSRSQTRQVFSNLEHVLAAAGAGFDSVVKTTVYLADMNDFTAMNEVYATMFASPAPARSTIQAARLPRDARVEIDVIARLPRG